MAASTAAVAAQGTGLTPTANRADSPSGPAADADQHLTFERARLPSLTGGLRRLVSSLSEPLGSLAGMYLLYVDESDSTGSENVAHRIYCVCGLRVVDSSYGQTTKRLRKVIESWQPSLPENFELKGYELFRGSGCWTGREPDERAAFAQKIAAALAESTIKLYVAMKASEDFGEDYRTLLGQVIAQAAKDTEKKGSKTGRQMMLVFDQRPDFNLRESTALRDMRSDVISRHRPSHFIDHGYEADSRHAPLIQAADFVAFHLRKRETLHREDSLLGVRADERLVATLDRLHETLAPKTIFIRK